MALGTGKTVAVVDATLKGNNPSGNTGANKGQGETAGVGQLNSAILAQRPLTSNTRNQGPDGRKSSVGEQSLPIITAAQRKVSRL